MVHITYIFTIPGAPIWLLVRLLLDEMSKNAFLDVPSLTIDSQLYFKDKNKLQVQKEVLYPCFVLKSAISKSQEVGITSKK